MGLILESSSHLDNQRWHSSQLLSARGTQTTSRRPRSWKNCPGSSAYSRFGTPCARSLVRYLRIAVKQVAAVRHTGRVRHAELLPLPGRELLGGVLAERMALTSWGFSRKIAPA
jgi:hypothetical protein